MVFADAFLGWLLLRVAKISLNFFDLCLLYSEVPHVKHACLLVVCDLWHNINLPEKKDNQLIKEKIVFLFREDGGITYEIFPALSNKVDLVSNLTTIIILLSKLSKR